MKLTEMMLKNSKAIEKNISYNKIKDFDYSKFRFLRTTFQFDEQYTLKLLAPGSNPKEYYSNVSCKDTIDLVDTPILFLHSKNDFICL